MEKNIKDIEKRHEKEVEDFWVKALKDANYNVAKAARKQFKHRQSLQNIIDRSEKLTRLLERARYE